jgi:hypothetical protein
MLKEHAALWKSSSTEQQAKRTLPARATGFSCTRARTIVERIVAQGPVGSYYFVVVLVVVVIRHETTAAARWALLLVVSAFINDAIAVAIRAGLHVCLPGRIGGI